jgi:hypothetical protein
VHNNPEDLMLNTARMHDVSHLSQYRIPIDIASIDFNSAIMNGAQQEVDSRKRANVSGRGLLGEDGLATEEGVVQQAEICPYFHK